MPTELPPNMFKLALREGRPTIGVWSALSSNIGAEILAGAGFDWIVIDTEHAPNEVPGVLAQLQAINGSAAEPVVRCAWNDRVLIKRVLDVGARSIIVPFVQDADEAGRAVAAARYPPRGVRGVAVATRAARFGRTPDYLRHADEQIAVVVQVETRTALGQIEAIAAVDGVDGLFIGPSDLAADLGHLGNPGHEEVQREIAAACARIRAAGKAAGFLTSGADGAARAFGLGFTFVAVGIDVSLLARGADELAARCRTCAPKP
jgi:4-hydroxy-2-oxoheptanedioate aldolase